MLSRRRTGCSSKHSCVEGSTRRTSPLSSVSTRERSTERWLAAAPRRGSRAVHARASSPVQAVGGQAARRRGLERRGDLRGAEGTRLDRQHVVSFAGSVHASQLAGSSSDCVANAAPDGRLHPLVQPSFVTRGFSAARTGCHSERAGPSQGTQLPVYPWNPAEKRGSSRQSIHPRSVSRRDES